MTSSRPSHEQWGAGAIVYGHAGDGNFHCNLLHDPATPEEYVTAKRVAHRMANEAIHLGGTCTGEHGVGTGKIKLLEEQFGPVGIDVMKSIKHTLDPKGIMNPGKVLPQ